MRPGRKRGTVIKKTNLHNVSYVRENLRSSKLAAIEAIHNQQLSGQRKRVKKSSTTALKTISVPSSLATHSTLSKDANDYNASEIEGLKLSELSVVTKDKSGKATSNRSVKSLSTKAKKRANDNFAENKCFEKLITEVKKAGQKKQTRKTQIAKTVNSSSAEKYSATEFGQSTDDSKAVVASAITTAVTHITKLDVKTIKPKKSIASKAVTTFNKTKTKEIVSTEDNAEVVKVDSSTEVEVDSVDAVTKVTTEIGKAISSTEDSKHCALESCSIEADLVTDSNTVRKTELTISKNKVQISQALPVTAASSSEAIRTSKKLTGRLKKVSGVEVTISRAKDKRISNTAISSDSIGESPISTPLKKPKKAITVEATSSTDDCNIFENNIIGSTEEPALSYIYKEKNNNRGIITNRQSKKALAAEATSSTESTDFVAMVKTGTETKNMHKSTKHAAGKSDAVVTLPPTIAASRSRRSIKPNPKYANEDTVTPKYVTALATEGQSGRKNLSKVDDYFNKDADDLIEEDRDELFDPRRHNTDDDLSDMEIYSSELMKEKPPPKRRGRPAKVQPTTTVNANSRLRSLSNTLGITGAQNKSTTKTTPAHLQQLRRTIAATAQRVGSSKRKTDISQEKALSANKRIVIAKTTNDGRQLIIHKSLQMANGAENSSEAISSKFSTEMLSNKKDEVNDFTQRKNLTKQVKKTKEDAEDSESSDKNTHTFTIVNISDIINQDDVLISKTATKKLLNRVLSNDLNDKRAKHLDENTDEDVDNEDYDEDEDATAVDDVTDETNVSGNADETYKLDPIRITDHMSTKDYAKNNNNNNSKNMNNGENKSAPRILNTDAGKKTQPMKPLMNMVDDMVKDIYPVITKTLKYDSQNEDIEEHDDNELETASRGDIGYKRKTEEKLSARRTAPSAAPISLTKRMTLMPQIDATKRAEIAAASKLSVNGGRSKRGRPRAVGRPRHVGRPKQVGRPRRNGRHSSRDDNRTHTNISPARSPLTLPPETTSVRNEGDRIITKTTRYEKWFVCKPHKEAPYSQRCYLDMPLVELANVVPDIKLPSSRWSFKVTLYKITSISIVPDPWITYTGDLTVHNIDEADRDKYQPSCVLFRRTSGPTAPARLPYDRALIFKNKCFYTNIEGKHVNLLGSPESITCVKDVELLLTIIDHLSLKSDLVELISMK